MSGVLIGALHLVIQNFRVDGVSMQPTFAAGEALIVDRTAFVSVGSAERFLFGGPRRGDVVIFRAPPEPDTDYIKRVIGLPGESVLIQHGRVFIDGQVLEEPYVQSPADYTFPGDGQQVAIPAGAYFVLGDNRPESYDSHTGWVVPSDYLIGRVLFRYWPPSGWGVVEAGQVRQEGPATAGAARP